MQNQIIEIINKKNIQTLFQPIVSLSTGQVMAYEALTRGPKSSPLENPVTLIEAAEKAGLLLELEFLMRESAIVSSARLNMSSYLFVNVDPRVIFNEGYKSGRTKDLLKKANSKLERIVFEITERSAIGDYKAFRKILDHFRNQGYQIAIDDAGSGFSGLKTIQEVEPEFIKIDMELIRDIHRIEFKQSLIDALVTLTRSTHIKLIAEGIETEEELNTLIKLGVKFGQGYYLGRPSSTLMTPKDAVKKSIIQAFENTLNQREYSEDYHYVGNITCDGITATPNVNTYDVKILLEKRHKESVVILEGDKMMGFVMKNHLEEQLSRQYGHALYANKPISVLMDKEPLIVDFYTPVHRVMKLAMARDQKHLYDSIIVCKGSKYHGIVTIQKLLEYASAIEKKYAKELNPLTSLPGNAIIERVITDLLVSDENYHGLLYIDLDYFKVFNDIYGFKRGDDLIIYTANLIKETARDHFGHLSFTGHIGGDDFMVLVQSDQQAMFTFIHDLIYRFDAGVRTFCHHKKSILDRRGQDMVFEQVYLSFAGLYGNFNRFQSVKALSAYMADLKKDAKSRVGHSHTIKETYFRPRLVSKQ